MNKSIAAGLLLVLLVGCREVIPSTTAPHPTATISQTASMAPLPIPITPRSTQVSSPYPLAKPGPYSVGTRRFVSEDASRENRKVSITVWYPALSSAGSTSQEPIPDATPDFSGKPYPLLLSSTKLAQILAPYLVTHGFTWASVDGIDYYLLMNAQMIDQPLDILFALNQVTIQPPTGLEGMIDADHAGAIGYSFDGYNTLAVSGARIDEAYYRAQCPTPDATTQAILGGFSAFDCSATREWDKFTAHAGKLINSSEDGLWQPMTDERIRAVMPLAGEGWWLFGDRGLAAVDLPVLMIVSSNDELNAENKLIFDQLGTPDKIFIEFEGQDHMMIYESEMVARMAHFAVAFFGFHLQGRQDLAQFFSEEYVAKYENLKWYGPAELLTLIGPSRCPRWWYRR